MAVALVVAPVGRGQDNFLQKDPNGLVSQTIRQPQYQRAIKRYSLTGQAGETNRGGLNKGIGRHENAETRSKKLEPGRGGLDTRWCWKRGGEREEKGLPTGYSLGRRGATDI